MKWNRTNLYVDDSTDSDSAQSFTSIYNVFYSVVCFQVSKDIQWPAKFRLPWEHLIHVCVTTSHTISVSMRGPRRMYHNGSSLYNIQCDDRMLQTFLPDSTVNSGSEPDEYNVMNVQSSIQGQSMLGSFIPRAWTSILCQ